MNDLDLTPMPSAPPTMSQADAFELACLRREEKVRQAARQIELETRIEVLETRLAELASAKPPLALAASSATLADTDPASAPEKAGSEGQRQNGAANEPQPQNMSLPSAGAGGKGVGKTSSKIKWV